MISNELLKRCYDIIEQCREEIPIDNEEWYTIEISFIRKKKKGNIIL